MGNYAFHYSLGEEHALRAPRWLTATDMRAALDALPARANSGDVYARLS